jgi:hypothetical protein
MQDAVCEIKIALVALAIVATPYLGCWWSGAAVPDGIVRSLATGRSVQMSGPFVGSPRVAASHGQSR